MAKLAQKILLFSTGILIASTAIKVILASADNLDQVMALLALLLFFWDQLTR